MVLYQFNNVGKSYGADEILADVNLQITDGCRIGLIGPNGSGKTTIAKILTGEELPSSGSLQKQRDASVGYLRQEPELPDGITLREYALQADAELLDIRHQLRELEHRIATGEASNTVTTRYGVLQEQYLHRGGYEYEATVETVLSRLGFRENEYDRQVSVLSGGQLSRLDLAALLVRKPNLLVLDEPTNHLDIQGIEWLEGYLRTYSGGVVVISHDRVFLDAVVNRIVEIEGLYTADYVGNYTAYLQLREERRIRQQKLYTEQRETIERTEDFIRKNIAGQKTKQAQGRRKLLEKVERLQPPSQQKHVRLRFPVSRRGGNQVLEVANLAKSFTDLTLFEDLSFTIRRGEWVGVVGPNGSGKSTLLRLITGEEPSDGGMIRIGAGIEVGYFDQRREGLNHANTVIDEVWEMKPSMKIGEIRGYLGSFMFREDEQFRVIGTLSGGEQSRVALAKLILDQTNFLILDEPTNHLDIPSRMALESALEHYEGTLFFVSHDRAFLRKLTNATIVIEDGKAKHYEYGYEAYEHHIAQKSAAESEETVPVEIVVPADKADRVREHQRRREVQRKRERRERRWAEIEETIKDHEDRLAMLDDQMNDPELSADWKKLGELTEEKRTVRKDMDTLYEEWAELEQHSSAGTQ
jgi:ATP-binding cassette, subfamily F, member 3